MQSACSSCPAPCGAQRSLSPPAAPEVAGRAGAVCLVPDVSGRGRGEVAGRAGAVGLVPEISGLVLEVAGSSSAPEEGYLLCALGFRILNYNIA